MNPLDSRRKLLNARTAVSGLLALAFCYVMLFVELPYYTFQPGTAENLQTMVKVGGGGYPESGSFLMTTVGVTRTTALSLLEAGLRSYDVRRINEVRKKDETGEEYGERQRQIMLTSQANAIQSAYKAAGISYQVANTGLAVLSTAEGYPASGILEPGDLLVSIDGIRVNSGIDMENAIAKRQAGDTVSVLYKRGNVTMEAAFTIRDVPKSAKEEKQRLGIGVVTADLRNVQPARPDDAVHIEAGEIGGPSAGFMFALEIYGLLLPEDLSKGYKIAGTGTIDEEGRIGVVGSIRHKVSAAEREGADLFFAPRDWYPSKGETAPAVPNATEAEKQARRLDSKMKVVAVSTLQEAIDYLESLPPKG